MRFHRLHPWTPSSLLITAAIGGLATLVGWAIQSNKQRDLDAPVAASWSASNEPPVAAPQVHSMESEQQLDLAFAAAFGGSDEVIRNIGTMNEPTHFHEGTRTCQRTPLIIDYSIGICNSYDQGFSPHTQ